MSSKGKLVLIIGPSGVGKSVILKALRKAHPELVFPRSATTRPRRPGEGNELYHFISDDQFDEWLERGKFIEWAQVHKGARYGTLIDEIIPAVEQGRTVVREVDVQGFDSIRRDARFSAAGGVYRLQTIFILPENEEQLIRRIVKRAPISGDELQRRTESMRSEIAYAKFTDAQVKNREGDLKGTIKEVEGIIENGKKAIVEGAEVADVDEI